MSAQPPQTGLRHLIPPVSLLVCNCLGMLAEPSAIELPNERPGRALPSRITAEDTAEGITRRKRSYQRSPRGTVRPENFPVLPMALLWLFLWLPWKHQVPRRAQLRRKERTGHWNRLCSRQGSYRSKGRVWQPRPQPGTTQVSGAGCKSCIKPKVNFVKAFRAGMLQLCGNESRRTVVFSRTVYKQHVIRM